MGPTPTPTPTSTVTVTFTNGTPTAAAVKMGSGAFATASVQNNQTSFTLPAGTTAYELAYVCPPLGPTGSITIDEFVIEATLSDGTTYSVNCQSQPPTGSATGMLDATAIPGAATAFVVGKGGFGGTLSGLSGSFNVAMPLGTNDVAVVVEDASNNVVAVKILRSQTVPGAINGGNPIVLGVADEVILEPVTVTNVPANFEPVIVFVQYRTANGTLITMRVNPSATYPAVPVASAQAGDSYFTDTGTFDAADDSVVVENEIFNNAGPLTINLPAVWSNVVPPAAAAFPTFTLNYTGFSAGPNVAFEGFVDWFTPGTSNLNLICVVATNAFQNGSTSLSVPDLSSLAGFLRPAPSGAMIGWEVTILNGQTAFSFLPTIEANGTGPIVERRGTFVEP